MVNVSDGLVQPVHDPHGENQVQVLGFPVRAEALPIDEWEKQARANGMSDYARQTLQKMFAYYDQYGLTGNPSVLAWILKQKPATFQEFISRINQENKSTSSHFQPGLD